MKLFINQQMLINGCITLCLLIGYHILQKPATTVTVNMTALTQQWISELAQSKRNQVETREQLTLRVKALEEILQSVSQDNDWIILTDTDVLAGALDITPYLAALVEKNVSNPY